MTSSSRQDEETLGEAPLASAVPLNRITPSELTPELIEEYRRQSLLAAEADALDPSIDNFTEAACLKTSEK